MEKKTLKTQPAAQTADKKKPQSGTFKKYHEVVFEGHYKGIKGLLEGFKLGSGKSEYSYYFSDEAGIKSSTMTEIILEYITLKNKLHHVIMSEDFLNSFQSALTVMKGKISSDNPAGKKSEEEDITERRLIRSAQAIKSASFKFKAETYGQKYGVEIKAMLSHQNIPADLELHNYNPIESAAQEDADENQQGRYTASHDYSFQATGLITGDLNKLISFRQKLDDHPLIEPDKIILTFEDK